MSCLDVVGYDSFSRKLADKAFRNCIPMFGMIELTYRCNLNCVHCYIPHHDRSDNLSTDEIKELIDELAAAGCLALLLTGGEPFLRSDFDEVYLHAWKKGLILYVFSNGSFLPERIIRLFARHKPNLVDISLYGASEDAYEKTTGRRVFCKVAGNIKRLQEAGMRVKVKTTLLKTNVCDYGRLVEFQRDLGLKLRLNMIMNYAQDGSDRPARFRLSPGEVLKLEEESEEVARQWRYSFSTKTAASRSSHLYCCGAGVNSYCITPHGCLKACGTIQKYEIDLKTQSFQDAWPLLREPMLPLKLKEGHQCRDCSLSGWCQQCAAWALLETGSEQDVVPYLCQITKMRAARFASPAIATHSCPQTSQSC